MVLVDTSVWIDHLRKGDPILQDLLDAGLVLTHPFIVGELACGNLKHRKEVLEFLQNLPRVPSSTEEEVLFFIEQQGISGKGIGYLDAHLLSSVSLSGRGSLWTRDRRLHSVALSLKISFARF